MASYPSQHAEARQNLKQDRPSPLHIVKRRRSGEYDGAAKATAIARASIDDSDSDVSSITDRTRELQIYKRRLYQSNPARQTFWASSEDVSHPQTKA
ncbi:hypothetical protein QQS21_010665 [Conoideocrella luteorostrata]|uniref:Uncharacterized protein n=1 Tax=Conoideocrella luteorostrata TaxID=1105319 RepID=A0AAJ0CJ20_9HYPO|nr:hypothetical protein QQS21_010665 [Conoideocrella luteorostrata]